MGMACGLAGLLVLSCTGLSSADAGRSKQECVSLLNDGLRAYDRGTELAAKSPAEAGKAFREAADAFQSIVNAGIHNGKLYYNLGNARLRCGQLGRSIAAYRRAERLMPADSRLEENLRYARSLCRYDIPDRTERAVVRTLFFWHFDASLRARFLVGLAAYVLFWLVLIGRTFVARVPRRYPAAVCLLIWVALAVSVGLDFKVSATGREGVISSEGVVVRKGDGEGYAPQFEQSLTDGVEFEVLEQRRDWLHIRLADGQEGWIPTAHAELI